MKAKLLDAAIAVSMFVFFFLISRQLLMGAASSLVP